MSRLIESAWSRAIGKGVVKCNIRDSDDDDGDVNSGGDKEGDIRTNMIISFRCGSKQTSPFSAAFGQSVALSALPRLRWSLQFFLSKEPFNYQLSKASLSIV